MIAIVAVDQFGDACVIVIMSEEFKKEALEIVIERNQKFTNEHCYIQKNINMEGFHDFNNRLLREINNLKYLESLGIQSERIVHCLEMLRFIRNDELGITFECGLKEESEWFTRNRKVVMENDN